MKTKTQSEILTRLFSLQDLVMPLTKKNSEKNLKYTVLLRESESLKINKPVKVEAMRLLNMKPKKISKLLISSLMGKKLTAGESLLISKGDELLLNGEAGNSVEDWVLRGEVILSI